MKLMRCLGMLILAAFLAESTARGQTSGTDPIYPPPTPLAPGGTKPSETPVPYGGGLSEWIVYKRDCCEGGPGAYTPMYTEAYFGAGPSFPIGNQTLGRELQTGWSFKTGVRALFFDAGQTRAWAADLHIMRTNESAGALNSRFPVTIFERGIKTEFGRGGLPGASLQNSSRTFAGLGIGRDWYFHPPADSGGCHWRLGLDTGGRYGSGRVNLNEFGHIVDVVGAYYIGGRADLEFPWGRSLVHTGVRCEWCYTWSDVLQQTSDVQDVTVFLNVGIRY